MLEMQNVSHILNHLHNFVRNKRGCAFRFPKGFWSSAIRNANFQEDFTDQPGAMSIFCFGTQHTSPAEPRTTQQATIPRPSHRCSSN
jgi:hypothetical protein